MFVTRFDTDVVVSPPNVEFCIDICAAEVGNEVRNEGQRVLVADSMVVNPAIVLYRTQLPVLLFDKEKG